MRNGYDILQGFGLRNVLDPKSLRRGEERGIVAVKTKTSTWNSAQCCVAAWMGGEFTEEWAHVYVWLRPFAVHLKLSQHW